MTDRDGPGSTLEYRHDIHPDTLMQAPTEPGRNESGEKNYRSENGE